MTKGKYSGTLRTDIKKDKARLENFQVVECQWERLLHRILKAAEDKGDTLSYCDVDGREGSLRPLLANHPLTVIADIASKRLKGYGETFVNSNGTAAQQRYFEKLEKDIEDWQERLQNYLMRNQLKGNAESKAMSVAQQLLDYLQSALQKGESRDESRYFKMLQSVTAIQRNATYYISQIEESGDMDGALSLFFAYLKNYCQIASKFNNRVSALPTLYRERILHVKPKAAVQDSAYIIVTPTKSMTLRQGTRFVAGQNADGEDLIYATTKREYISPSKCTEICMVYPKQNSNFQFGWEIESEMLVLGEGEREIEVWMDIDETDSPDIPNSISEESYSVLISTDEGWTELKEDKACRKNGGKLCIRFSIASDKDAPTKCEEEKHGNDSVYPVLRIVGSDGFCDWAHKLRGASATIKTHVKGIRNFTFYNELGEVDTAAPFQPFGIQAERGAWFMFGNEEMGLKPLEKVSMKGVWQKMPERREEIDNIYRYYGVDGNSFVVKTEMQKKGKWQPCGNEQKLFTFEDNGKLKGASIEFDFAQENSATRSATDARYEYAKDKDGFFRVTLVEPQCGFGSEAYRKAYCDVAIHNSQCKKKDRLEMPTTPVTPTLTDVELEYCASAKAMCKTLLFADGGRTKTPYNPYAIEENSIYFTFRNTSGERWIRFYVHIALQEDTLFIQNIEDIKNDGIAWECKVGEEWTAILAKDILQEETNGLMQSGYVEVRLPENIVVGDALLLRAAVSRNASDSLCLKNVWTNCIKVTATNGEGKPLPSGTIQQAEDVNERIESIEQPLQGFGGKQAETEEDAAAHTSARISNRHRAVNGIDYEKIAIEHFPKVSKAVCLPTEKAGNTDVTLVVFGDKEENKYRLLPLWELTEIKKKVEQYTSSFVNLQVVNAAYERIGVNCTIVLKDDAQDVGVVRSQLETIIKNYIAPWQKESDIPELGLRRSYRELHSRIACHEAVKTVTHLDIDGKGLPDDALSGMASVNFNSNDDIPITGTSRNSVLVADVKVKTEAEVSTIGRARIGNNFQIK